MSTSEYHTLPLREQAPAALACIIWATAFVCVKISLEYLPPLTIAGMRFILAGILLIPLCKGLRPLIRLCREQPTLILWVGFYQTIVLYGAFFLAMPYVRGAQAAIIIGSSPLTSAVAAHLTMGQTDRMNRGTLISVACGIAGIVLISLASKPWDPVGLPEFIGMVVLFIGSIASALGNIAVAKRRHQSADPIALNALQMLFGGLVLGSCALVFEGVPQLHQPLAFWLALGWLACISASAFSIWFFMLKKVRVSQLNIWKFLIPVFGSAFAWMILPEEHPDTLSLMGMGLVTVGIIAAVRLQHR